MTLNLARLKAELTTLARKPDVPIWQKSLLRSLAAERSKIRGLLTNFSGLARPLGFSHWRGSSGYVFLTRLDRVVKRPDSNPQGPQGFPLTLAHYFTSSGHVSLILTTQKIAKTVWASGPETTLRCLVE